MVIRLVVVFVVVVVTVFLMDGLGVQRVDKMANKKKSKQIKK